MTGTLKKAVDSLVTNHSKKASQHIDEADKHVAEVQNDMKEVSNRSKDLFHYSNSKLYQFVMEMLHERNHRR